ncbi:8769_t:CDS:1, partial [Paraglomus brasilianum]
NIHMESTEEPISTLCVEQENSPLWLPGHSNGYSTNGLADPSIGEDIPLENIRKRGRSNGESEDCILPKRARIMIEEEFQEILPLRSSGGSGEEGDRKEMEQKTNEENLLTSPINFEDWDWDWGMVEAAWTNLLNNIGTGDNDNDTDPLAWEIIVPEETNGLQSSTSLTTEVMTPVHPQIQTMERQNKEENGGESSSIGTSNNTDDSRWTNWDGKAAYDYKGHKGQKVFHKGEANDAEIIQRLQQSKAILKEDFNKREAYKLGEMLQDKYTSSLARRHIKNYYVDLARRIYILYEGCTEEEMKDGWGRSHIWKRPMKDLRAERQRRATLKAAKWCRKR